MRKKGSTGVEIVGGEGNFAQDNVVFGFDTGVRIEGGKGNHAVSNFVLSSKAATLFLMLRLQTKRNRICLEPRVIWRRARERPRL
jgi:hypothetical protein